SPSCATTASGSTRRLGTTTRTAARSSSRARWSPRRDDCASHSRRRRRGCSEMADLIPAEEFKAYLIGLGVVQDDTTPPSLAVPSVWLNPRDEAPEPRTKNNTALENVTVSILEGPELPRDWLEGFLQEKVFEFVVRSRKKPQGT